MRKSGQRLDQRKIGLARTVLVETLAKRNLGRVRTSQLFEKSISECALANPGLAGDEKKLATARARFIEAARKLPPVLRLSPPTEGLRVPARPRSAG